jgi:hypothetical protein
MSEALSEQDAGAQKQKDVEATGARQVSGATQALRQWST